MKKKDSANEILKAIKTKDSLYWEKKREKNSLKLFHSAAEHVPAYKDFLKKQKVNHTKIKTWADFQNVPLISKSNYLREYPYASLFWDGTIKKPLTFTATSGSTGEPFYFARQEVLDWQYSIIIQKYLEKQLISDNSPTLVIICFGMGIWIGGLITYKAFEIAGLRCNYPLSIITPGISKKEIFNALKMLSPQYKQTLLVGYPPFIKDIIDEAPIYDINLKKLNLRFLFAAEAVTEEFRSYIAKKSSIHDIETSFMSIYGSADIGAMAFESTGGILIRRLADKNKKLFHDIFSPINKAPTLAQYIPDFINFEAPNGEIVLTGDNAIPLVRYAIGDHGGVLAYSQVEEKMKAHGIDLQKYLKEKGVGQYVSKLPFVYVYERINMSTNFYGLLIYPEWIRKALIDNSVAKFVSGKFTLITQYDEKQNQYLEINIELRKGYEAQNFIETQVLKKIVKHLLLNSSEYRELHNHLKDRALPKLKFWPSEDPLYFQPGVKQKWVKN